MGSSDCSVRFVMIKLDLLIVRVFHIAKTEGKLLLGAS